MKHSMNGKSKSELEKALSDARKGVADFRFAISGSKGKNVREGRNLRRRIARIETALKSAQ